jgi:glycosyltransferase involved in cell wall biosynthesis
VLWKLTWQLERVTAAPVTVSNGRMMFLRIAQVAPLYESVPPKLYGGTERVVSYLTEELVNQGHEVTLFASGDSVTKSTLIPTTDCALRLNPASIDTLAHHILMLEQVSRRCEEFDVLHFHIDYLHFPLSRRLGLPAVTTLHGRLDLPDLVALYREFRDMPVISISNSQRKPLPGARWMATVPHGLPSKLYTFSRETGQYLAFIGRISPEKRLDRAIEIAQQAGMPLKIAAKVDKVDVEYFRNSIEPLLHSKLVEYVGEIDEHEKDAFFGNAYALLFPIDWEEPFGLVMIESLACGTPVIAFNRGSVPEVIQDGVTGFIVNNVDEAVEAVNRIPQLSRTVCRRIFELRFTAERMAREYVDVYRELMLNKKPAFRQELEWNRQVM